MVDTNDDNGAAPRPERARRATTAKKTAAAKKTTTGSAKKAATTRTPRTRKAAEPVAVAPAPARAEPPRAPNRPAPAPAAAPPKPVGPPVIVANDLVKRFSNDVVAVNHLSFDVTAGSVVGFVGPNGSGKTTTIRLLLGLIKPTSGTGTVLGHSIQHPERYLPDIGPLIEEPAFYPNLSGRKNLLVQCRLRGIPADRIGPALAAVGLEEAADRTAGTYSLGMRKRLAIAGALIPNPKLLILDEPANGLDPMGIRDVRQLLRHLADQGRTVFVSSHLLSEVEQACDSVVVIQKGRMVFQGPLDELLATEEAELVVAAEDPGDHLAVRKICGEAGHPAEQRGDRIYVRAPASFAAELNRACMDAGVTLVELRRERLDLERVFFDLTKDMEEVGA